jgi:hypothetical protein
MRGTPMRSLARLTLAAVVIVIGPLISACDSIDTFELFDSKKKLAGDRKDVFPEGVPGATTGVPPDLVKGYREPEQGVVSTDPAKMAAEAAAAEHEKPKAKPKPTPAPAPQRTAAKPPPKPAVDPYAARPAAASSGAPGPAPQASAPPPQAAAPPQWPASQPQAAAPWPGAPGGGTTAR